MSDIIGTIISVGDFLNNEDKEICIKKAGEDGYNVFNLKKNRKYIIPDFQREIRWSEQNVNTLLQDIKSNNKFLGNIILARYKGVNYHLIDGQQRITVLLLIIQYLKAKFSDKIYEIKNYSPCNLCINSFPAFSDLMDKNFILGELTE